MSRLHFIFNPVAGNGLSQKAFARMEECLRAQSIDYSVARSEYAGHAPALAREAVSAGHGCIVAVGGDGTVREVAEAMIGASIPLGILPCGTGNDLVRSLQIPSDPAAVLEMLLHGEPRSMDAGEANGKLFFNVAGFGFDVDVLEYTELYKKRFRGLTAYILGLLHALTHMQMRRVCVTTPEGMQEFNALEVAVGNGTHFGGGMNVTPLADPCDGMLDICIIHSVTKLTVLQVLTRFVKGKHVGMSKITHYFNATEISVESDPPSPLELDGEITGQTPVTFKLLPGVLQIICGRKPA